MPSATLTDTTHETRPQSVTNVTPRRSLFGAAALLALATPARAADYNPDAELIALCAEFDALERQFLATDFAALPNTPAGEAAEQEQARLADGQRTIAGRISSTPFSTMQGAVALASTLAFFTGDMDGTLWTDDDGYIDQRLHIALMRGLIRVRAAA